jgi:hypothetical protein
MQSKISISLVWLAMMAAISFGYSAAALHGEALHPADPRQGSDPITGEWTVLFTLQGTVVQGKFDLKLDREKVTGTVETEHTGPGTLSKGSWVDNKLSFTLDFKKHESIAVTGSLKDGKLVGEFRTEGMQGQWEAKRK